MTYLLALDFTLLRNNFRIYQGPNTTFAFKIYQGPHTNFAFRIYQVPLSPLTTFAFRIYQGLV